MNISLVSNPANSTQLPLSFAQPGQLTDLFLKYGIVGQAIDDVDENGQTVLAKATIAGDERAVRQLISEGANKKATDRAGYTILSLAVLNGHFHITELLLKSGLSIWDLDNKLREGSTSVLYSNKKMYDLLANYGLRHRCL